MRTGFQTRGIVTLLIACTFVAVGCGDDTSTSSPTPDAVSDTDTVSDADADVEPGGPNDTLKDSIAFNELVMRCTHNSYHRRPDFDVVPATFDYGDLPLSDQLDAGVRAFELDIHTGENFPVLHIPVIDPNSVCADLEVCFGDIASWSERNPTHQMLVVWIEVKDELDAGTITDYAELDRVIRTAIGEERIYTMDDFMRGEASPRAALDAKGWPTVGETRGRVAVVLLDVDEPHYGSYRAYAGDDERAMFSRARAEDYEEPWAVFAKIDNPSRGDEIQAALDFDMMVASNTGAADDTDEANESQLDDGLENGTHMLCDDFPVARAGDRYSLDRLSFFPSGCNAKTASADCVPSSRPPADL